MILTSNIKMDLIRPETTPIVEAMQDDRYARNLAIALYQGPDPWLPPGDGAVIVRYIKSDGCGGEYDTMPDDTPAWSISENVVTVALAPQVLTTAGTVQMDVGLYHDGAQLSTFRILIHVHPKVGGQLMDSENYLKVTSVAGYLPAPGSPVVGEFVRVAALSRNGFVTATDTVSLTGLPPVGAGDDGKVLQVDASGNWVPAEMTVFVTITQREYDALADAGGIQEDILYMIVGETP